MGDGKRRAMARLTLSAPKGRHSKGAHETGHVPEHATPVGLYVPPVQAAKNNGDDFVPPPSRSMGNPVHEHSRSAAARTSVADL